MYYPNGIIRKGCRSYYSLSFVYDFQYIGDTVYFAYCFPFTYSELLSTLDEIESDPVKCAIANRKTLCRTIGGNKCDYLTVTNRTSINATRAKKGAVISARVHPGETVGSWIMQGVLEFLVSQDPRADLLRELYVFKIVPMLNPDGVINGNYRCSLAGCDLNRRWKTPHQVLHPVIHGFKKLIRGFKGHHELDIICDLHGHSRKKNIFMYGCNVANDPSACKLFPYILSKISPVFNYNYCRFGV